MNYASGGSGTPTFLAAELFKAQTAIDLQHVPYRSGGEALTAVITGEAPVYFAPLAASLPHVQQGRLRALAVTSAKRVPVVSELPTVAELGYPGFETGNWYGLPVPARTPKEIIIALNRAAVTAVDRPSVKKRLTDLGYVIIADQPDQFAAHIKSEIDKLGRIVKQFRLSAD